MGQIKLNLGVCLLRQKRYNEAKQILEENLQHWKKGSDGKFSKKRYWTMFNLADVKSKIDHRDHEVTEYFAEACTKLHELCVERDRFFLFAKVLWAKHLFRCAEFTKNDDEKHKFLKEAVVKAKYAYMMFKQTLEDTHPDTRRAAKVLWRINSVLNPDLVKDEYAKFGKFGENTYARVWNPPEQQQLVAKKTIQLMHWNILADKLAWGGFKRGSFGCNIDLLRWDPCVFSQCYCRKDKVCAEIIKYDPDVLILVELDHYEDIRFILEEEYGYKSVWQKKGGTFFTDGTGLFWKKKRFKCKKVVKEYLRLNKDVKEYARLNKDFVHVFFAVELHPQQGSGEDFCPFVTAGIHLKSRENSECEKIRLDQCKQVVELLHNEFPHLPVVMGATLNTENNIRKNTSTGHDLLAYPYLTKTEDFVSAYKSVRGDEPEFTSWKFRIRDPKVTELKYTHDYVFHSPDIKAIRVLEVPNEQDIDMGNENESKEEEDQVQQAMRRCLLPSAKCPSDHVSLVADVVLPKAWSI